MGRISESPILKRARRKIQVGGLELEFQRTCRVPYDKVYGLPAGLGPFPIYDVEDFSDTAPKDWDRKDLFMPMYQCEALWINFQRYRFDNPSAALVGSGAINAVSGKKIEQYKLEEPQNYLSVPPQPWLDGWKDTDGKIYQFVAADLGSGQTVEGQITGEEKVGGIQLAVFKPKPDAKLIPASRPREYITAGGWPGWGDWDDGEYPSWWHRKYLMNMYNVGGGTLECFSSEAPAWKGLVGSSERSVRHFAEPSVPIAKSVRSMGLGRGGSIRQKIYDDPYGFKVWQAEPAEVRTVHILNSQDFIAVTGCNPPQTPINYKTYQMYGYPWFDLWDKELEDTKGSDVFGKLKPVEVAE